MMLLAMSVSYYAITQDVVHPYGWKRTVLFGIPAVMIVAGTLGLERKGIKIPIWLVRIGDCSYSLYLSHLIVMGIVAVIWRRFLFQGWLDNLLFIFIMILGSLVASWLIWLCIEKPADFMTRKLNRRLFGTEKAKP